MKESYVLKYKEKYNSYAFYLSSFEDEELAREICLILNKCVANLNFKFSGRCIPACWDNTIDVGLFIFENVTSSELKKDIIKNMHVYKVVTDNLTIESRKMHESYMCSLLAAVSPFSIITTNHFEKA